MQDAEEWLPAGYSARQLTPVPNGGPPPAPATAPAADVERLRAELKEAELRARAAQARALQAERALEQARREARRAAARRRPARPAAAPAGGGDGIDLNSASFETLRNLGLSITQSARLIAQRERRGGLRSLDEVETLYGLPRELKARLRERCTV